MLQDVIEFTSFSLYPRIQANLTSCAGVNVLAENNVPSFVLVNAIFLLGTFTFAVVLGVVSDDIGSELKVCSSAFKAYVALPESFL